MNSDVLFLCRPLYESSLVDELKARHQFNGQAQLGIGYVQIKNLLIPNQALVFERQRLVRVKSIPLGECKPIAATKIEEIMAELIIEPMPWACFLFTQEESTSRLPINLEGLWREIQKQVFKSHPALKSLERKADNLIAQNRGKILQLFLCDDGLFYSCSNPSQLSAKTPGGIRRMRFDSGAPSRSYLKIEEALDVMEIDPRPGSTVVDLGAAPGGWTYSFAKRGCHVTSVDNGPMKIRGSYSGTIEHLQRDGLSFNPAPQHLPIDWFIADMLIPPPQALLLLKKWVGQNWCKHLIVNIKLPQQNPYAGLGAILDWIYNKNKHNLQIRQLYHDRQEVTIYGSLLVKSETKRDAIPNNT